VGPGAGPAGDRRPAPRAAKELHLDFDCGVAPGVRIPA
jgi:hypothetical protein